ncbi:metal ABC transporter permease [Sinomonas susongensis]|uniref:metal ABC transporter permease n=1 Tax=Sinomonas susongensis TaxID=1324851 RepID=UPI001BB1C9E4|nr:metal ABC transporter permease [Sinomonas susongensis]
MTAPAASVPAAAWILSQPYMQNAFLAGTAVALLAGLVGYFVVLRGQVFAGDALSHAAYTGALAALAAGVDIRLGLFAATVGIGFALGFFGGRGAADDVVIGTTFSWILGLGVFFLSIFTSNSATGNGAANVRVLFGSILGISTATAQAEAWTAAGLILVLLAIARPLLYASIDPAGAAARGVPVRILGPFFLALVGAVAATASQLVGALLVFGLLAAPPAAARRLTSRPWTAFWLAGAFAVAAVWAGLLATYYVPVLPASFTLVAAATVEYAAAAAAGPLVRAAARRPARAARQSESLAPAKIRGSDPVTRRDRPAAVEREAD